MQIFYLFEDYLLKPVGDVLLSPSIDSDINLSVSGTGVITFTALGATIGLNEAGDTNLSAGFTATTLVGGLNEVKTFKEEVFLPIAWGRNGTAPPALDDDVTSGNGVVSARKFSSASTEDVVFPWQVPADIVASDGITFKVIGIVTEAVAPAATEGVSFKLSGYSIGVGDSLNGTFGTEVESKDADLNASGCTAQYDMFQTAESGTVTITDLAAGETAMLHFERDTADADDDYGQDVGVIGVVVKYSRQTVGA